MRSPASEGQTSCAVQIGRQVAFVTLTRFESIDSVRGFAGDDYEVPMLEPEAIALLSRYEDRASHFETASFLA